LSGLTSEVKEVMNVKKEDPKLSASMLTFEKPGWLEEHLKRARILADPADTTLEL